MTKSYDKLDQPEIARLLFQPRREEKPEESHFHNIDVLLHDGTLLGCTFHVHDKASPIILFFHGNGETAGDYDETARLFNNAGINLFVATYRGYGWSTGSPSVQSMMKDSLGILDVLQKTMAAMEMTGALFVMGRSIGSAPAIELCTGDPEPIKGLIIESGFADTIPLLKSLGYDPDKNLITEKEGFGNRDKITEVTLPTLILHGSADSVIPAHQAERLQAFSGARAKKFFVVPEADHDTVASRGGDLYFSTIRSFIGELIGEHAWQKRKKYRDRD